MAAPWRGNTGYGCYFITASTFQKRNILQCDRMARLLLDLLLHYRAEGKYLLHEFIVMQEHFHLLNSPRESLERAMQLNKAVFLFRQKENLDAYMRVGSLASRSAGMRESISLFESTSVRMLQSLGWR
jgi:REP element-mobilizing transposase RayT